MTDKTDFKKSLAAYTAQRGRLSIVDVPDLRYLMVDGHGDRNTSPALADAIEALYPVAYKLKFASKRRSDTGPPRPLTSGACTKLDSVRTSSARHALVREYT